MRWLQTTADEWTFIGGTPEKGEVVMAYRVVITHVVIKVVVPDTFNDDHYVDEPEINKSLKLVLFDKSVVILFKSEMFE